jgi:hypothetical protein
MPIDERKRFAAPCGLYCGACSIRAAYNRKDASMLKAMADGVAMYLGHDVGVDDLACDGCLSDTLAAPCRECKIRDCAYARGLTHCSECSDFPCDLIKNFNDDGMPHHSEVLKNIRRQKEVGLEAWLAEQAERWRCPGCSAEIDWYAGQCAECDNVLGGQF